ncbi:MAG: anaerobic sulfatase maturase [Oscillospiraceae bacterium]|nr:anaerobic sulfatase maturase [Oscillospiraceae bacterium]
MPAISCLMKPSSGMCNMRCDYCFYCDETEKRRQESYGFMSEETLRSIIRRTLPLAEGVASYAFQGGEPTLRGLDFFRTVVKLERQYNRSGVRIHNALQTNGTLIDEEWCRFLKDYEFLVGVSIDGTEDVHNRFRHFRASDESPWERAVHATELMDKYKVEYNILTVVNAETVKNISEIYRFYEKQGWHWQQYIACLDPLDEEKGKDPWSLTPEMYGDFLIELFGLWYDDAKLRRQPYIRQFENWLGILVGYIPEACDQRGECSVQYVCEADGSVYPCDFYMLDEYRLGNFNEDKLADIDRKREEIGFIERSRKLDEGCRSCPYHSLCRGGCQRNRDLTQEGIYRNYFCESYKEFFSECLPQLKELAKRV